jgi:hypothetical protein
MVVNFFGSVLSQLVTEKSGYLDMATELTENPDAAADIVMAHAAGLGLFFLWAVLLLGFMIAGIVLFFVKRKQLTFGPGVVTLEKGKRFSTIVGNLGAILFIIFWIVLSLFNMGIL